MNKDANRAAMPGVAAIVDEFRAAFPDLKVVFSQENGLTIDRREPVNPDSVFQIPEGYAPMWQAPTKERK